MKKIVFLIVVFAMMLTACGKHTTTWQEQYDLGVRFLSEGNYEEAVIAFNAAIDIDPLLEEAYTALAEVYWAQGRYDLALEILERGYAATESLYISKLLNAEKANQLLAESGKQETLQQLFQALAAGNHTEAADYMDAWTSSNEHTDISSGHEILEFYDYSMLVYDGERFAVETDVSALVFDGPDRVYYGEQASGIPNGDGTLLSIHSRYPSGGVKYYCLTGHWDNGAIVGEARVWDTYSSNHQGTVLAAREMMCVFNDEGIMVSAEVTEQWDKNYGPHQFMYSIKDGKLTLDGWVYEDLRDFYVNGCILHSDCDTILYCSDPGAEVYMNPLPWGEEAEYSWWAYGDKMGLSY